MPGCTSYPMFPFSNRTIAGPIEERRECLCYTARQPMSDFFQHGLISNLHRLVDGPIIGTRI